MRCEHCGNPDKAKFLSSCQYPNPNANFDSPCICDAYDQGQRELATYYHSRRWLDVTMAILLILLAPLFLFFYITRDK